MGQKRSRKRPAISSQLRPLARLIGTWRIRGRTSDSPVDNIRGTTRIAWSPDGRSLEQRSVLRVGSFEVYALEVVTTEGRPGSFPAWVFSNGSPKPLPYRWVLRGNAVEHSGLGATYRGRFSRDGRTIVGRWQPNPGHRSTPANSYDATMTRVRRP